MPRNDLPGPNDIEIFKEELDANMQALRKGLELLGEKDQKFATSLCDYYERWDRLSSNQIPYACKFWQEINAYGIEGRTTGKTELRESLEKVAPSVDAARVQIDSTKIFGLFAVAAQNLKKPTIRYTTTDPCDASKEVRLTIGIGGSHTRYPGSIWISMLKDPTFKDTRDTWLHIMIDGKFRWGLTAMKEPKIQQFLKRLLEGDLVETFAVAGKRLKSCCYCGISLTDDRSLAKGYGPICADNWGLPWGDEVAEITEMDLGL